VSEDERASEPGNRVDLQFNTTQGRRQVRKQLSPARRQRRDHAAMPAPHGADGPDGDPRCSGRRDDQPAHFGERTPVGNLAPGQHPSHAVPLQSGLILEGKKRTSRGVGNGRPRALLAVRPLCPAIARTPWSAAPPGELRDGPRGPPKPSGENRRRQYTRGDRFRPPRWLSHSTTALGGRRHDASACRK
jgi:hypothetical protein